MAEYRVVGRDNGDWTDDEGGWHRLLASAEKQAEEFMLLEPAYDEVWIERRVPPEEPPVERIKTLRGPATTPSKDKET